MGEDPKIPGVEHYIRVQRMASIGSWRWLPETQHLWWSVGMHQVFGTDPETFDQRMESLFEAALPEDRHILTEAAARYEATGVPELLKYRIRRPDGAIRHVWAFGEALVDDGALVAVGYVIDVTDRDRLLQEERDKFSVMVANAPIPAALYAEDGAILLVNRRFTELTGLEVGDMPTAREWAERACGEEPHEALQRILAPFSTDSKQDEGELRIRTKHGGTRDWLFSSSRVGKHPDGRKLVLWMAQDVTDLRRLQAEELTRQLEAQRAQRVESLGVLAGGIAHDFNNLLMGVLGSLDIAMRVTLDPKVRRILSNANLAAKRAAGLSRDMLTYAGRQTPNKQDVDFVAVFETLRPLLRTSISHGIELVFEPVLERAIARLGESQLDQVIMNLVSNAGNAIGKGPGRITVRAGVEAIDAVGLETRILGRDAEPGAFAYVEVEDTGAGMAPKTIDRFFEPFFTTNETSRGLGTSIILGIARASGGVLQVSSELGVGTRIRVSIPRSPGGRDR